MLPLQGFCISVVESLRILRFLVPPFGLFAGERFTGYAVLALDPFPEVDKLAPLGTERTILIVFPFDWFTAGWTLHRYTKLAGRKTSIHRVGHADYNAAGRFISIRRLTKAIVPARRMAFKRTVTLSRVEPTMEAISRWGRGMSMSTPSGSDTP